MKKAFSLIEMMLVLTIISILIGTMKVNIQRKKLEADAKKIVELARVCYSAIMMYYLRNGGTFPSIVAGGRLENEPDLKPYCPAGVKSRRSDVKISGFNDMFIQSNLNVYGIHGIFRFYIEFYKNVELKNEVLKQLEESGIGGKIESEERNDIGLSSVYVYLIKLGTSYIH